jgi:hypothetical protein
MGRRIAGFTAVMAAVLAGVSPAAQRGAIGTVRVADAAWDLELVDATASDDGATVWIVAGARPRGRRSADPALRVLRVTSEGVQASVELASLRPVGTPSPGAAPARRHVVQAIALGPDGRPLLALARSALPVSLVPVSANGREVGAPVPIALTADADLVGLVRLSTGRLLMLGAAGLRPLVAEVSPSGAVAWERVLPGQEPVALTDAVPTADGGAVLLGRSGTDARSARLWIGALSPKGELLAQQTVSGFDGEVARLADGTHVLAVDQVSSALFDSVLMRLGPRFETVGTTPLLKGQPNSGVLRLAALPGGGFLLAGVRDRGLWIARFDGRGQELWSDARTPAPPQLELVSAVALLPRGTVLVVPYGAYVLEGREQRQVISVLRLRAD